MNEKTTEIPTDDKTKVEIIPFGSDERISLNVAIVQNMIAVPSRSGKLPDFKQCMKFLLLCKTRHLNPFEGDAYLIGYDLQGGGTEFSLITAQQVFLKRAEASEGFDGMESGVIVKGQEGLVEREGDLLYVGEELLGGWAKVYRKDRGRTFYRRLKLETFNTGRSRWAKDPAGMIVKCAEADALRTAFPTHLGGLYLQEERQIIDISPPAIERAKIEQPKIEAPKPALDENKQTPRRGRPRKQEPDSTEPVGTPNRDELFNRLKMAYSTNEFVELAVSKKWIDPDQKFEDIDEEKAKAFVDNFENVMVEMDAYFAKKPAASSVAE